MVFIAAGVTTKGIMIRGSRRASRRARQHHGFDKELRRDVAASCAERAADADLPRSFGHGGEHDVHDADAADHERDGGDGAQHDVEDLLRSLGALQQLERHDDVVILLLVIRSSHP